MTSTDASTDVATEPTTARLAAIEAQPLESRSKAYAQLHDELQGVLEGSDVPSSATA